jgi:hypothetical protein
MSDIAISTQIDRPLERFYMLWISQQLSAEQLTKIQSEIDSFIDAESNLTWTLIRFRSSVGIGRLKVALPPEAKYILQVDAEARVLSCNFNMDEKQAKMMREFLARFRKPALKYSNNDK